MNRYRKTCFSAILAAMLSVSLCSCDGMTASVAAPDAQQSEAAASPTETASTEAVSANIDTTVSTSDSVLIDLGGNIDAVGVKKTNGGIKITKAGTYTVTGKLEGGSVTVDASDGRVCLILSDAQISCSNGAAIKVKKYSDAVIMLEGSSTVSGGGEDDAAISSKAALALFGAGALTVNGTDKHGIEAAGELLIKDCKLDITANNVGINGKGKVVAQNADITVNAGTDGIRAGSDNSAGTFGADGGTITVTASGDGIQATSEIAVTGGSITVTTGGGSDKKAGSDTSSKGIKSDADIAISGGTLNISSSDDAIHSNANITVSGGSITLSTGDDGIHGDTSLTISGGDINIEKSYEGLESALISISGGNIRIAASDDGINAAGGKDSSGFGGFGGFGGKDKFGSSVGTVSISCGYIFVNANGDGIDSNDTIEISGGVTLICGPTGDMDAAFDYESSSTVSGGVLIALGSSGMAQGITNISNQGYILYNTQKQSAGTTIAVCGADGKAVVAFSSDKTYSSALVTSPDIKDGEYTIVTGAEISGADINGFAQNTDISGGTTLDTVTVANGSYSNGSFGGFGGGFGGFGGFGGGGFGGDRGDFDFSDFDKDLNKDFNKGNFGGRGDRQKFDPSQAGERPEMPQDSSFPEPPQDGSFPEPPQDGSFPEPPQDGSFPEPPQDGNMPELPQGMQPPQGGMGFGGQIPNGQSV